MPAPAQRRITAEDLYRIQTINGCQISPDGQHAVFSLGRVKHATEKKYANLWIVPTRDGTARQFTYGWLRGVDLGTIEEIWYEGAAGNDLQGWILKPPGFDPAKIYPSILEIHGGPLGQYGNVFMHEFYYLAAHGYIVYFSNPRGGQGYGEEHARSTWTNQ